MCSSTFSAKQRTEEAKWKKTKRKNAEDGWANENLQRVRSSKSQLQCIRPPSLSNKEHWKRNEKKTQKTSGQMKRCRAKNRIFSCNKKAEDGEEKFT